LQVAACRQHALEEKTYKAKEKAKKQAQRQAKKEAKEHAKATKKAAKPVSACKLKPKLPKPLKEQVVVGKSSGGNQGVPCTPKPVLVKSSRTRTVLMP
jgi:uncharacterized protein YggE